MLILFITVFRVHFTATSGFSYMYGWQQFNVGLLSWGGLLSSFNLPTYVILAGLAPFFLDTGLVHSIPCPVAFGFPTLCSVVHWPPHQLTCHRNCAISRMLFLFSSSHNTEACTGRKQRPYKGDQSCAWSLQTPVPSPVPSRPCRETPRLQVDLELQTTLVSVLQERGRQGV